MALVGSFFFFEIYFFVKKITVGFVNVFWPTTFVGFSLARRWLFFFSGQLRESPTNKPLAKPSKQYGREELSTHVTKKIASKPTHTKTPQVPKTSIPCLSSRWENQRPSWPTRIVIQRHSFWKATPKSCSVQQWTFDIACKRSHKVCIVLLWRDSRLYSSFSDVEAFWEFYSRFQDRRCFYWINRSSGIKEEASILHFDVEWYTKNDDPNAAKRLSLIKTTVAAPTSSPISFYEERLSRPHQEYGLKNSFHIYTDWLFEHNAQGCMRKFVKNQVWGKLKSNPRMRCPSVGKPILDLGIYTKNRTFRVPDSCKTTLPTKPMCDPIIPLPSKEFFIVTRMADRRKFSCYIPQQIFLRADSTTKNCSTSRKKKKNPTWHPLHE